MNRIIGEPDTNFAEMGPKRKLGVIITCDRCQEQFDEKERVPTILPDCAHTLCALCVYDIIDNEPDKCCFICNQEITDISDPESFKANFKLLSILSM
jgi:hypothetical protein